uniref:BZIP domain-containing protein n=1 Tax=Fusarium oxysporum (strain Fo5176) TaxID=660025 RepID=A0A0D2YD48_FUSOF
MEFQQSPLAKFDNSPAESLMSIPGDGYASLFAVTTPSASSTMNPMQMMTPKSYSEDQTASFTHIKEEEGITSTPSPSPSPAPEKKTTKKRKSWGQVLPEPKTHLPPRKRAKTEDEKEQRRVERVLRNRRAAQSSRERKRQEVEALEKRNQELKAAFKQAQEANARLMMELEKMRRSSGVAAHSSPLESFLSHVGGDAQVVPVIANLGGANLGLAPAASDDAAFSLGDSYFLSATADADRLVFESGYLSSLNSSIIGDDNMVGDALTFNLNEDFDLFDVDGANAISSDPMATSDFAAAINGLEPKIYEPEIQVP